MPINNQGENNPFYGRKHSKESLKRMSDAKKGKHYSPKTEFKKGIKPWMTGKTHTEETK